MDKITYLTQLAEGLARWVPERERQDILRYYAEYFEEAGPEREAQVIQELGDPWALSCRLAVEGGYVTYEQANSWTPPKKKRWPWVVIGVAAVLVFVVGSVASAASRIGRVIGQYVAGADPVYTEVAVVDEGTAFIVGGDTAEYWESWTMEDAWLEPFRAIDADISMGNITITGGDDYTLFVQPSGNLGGYSVKWEIEKNTLKIRDGSSGSHNIGLDGLGDLLGQKGLDVVITVPEGEVLQKITAKTDFGNVFLADLNVEVKVEAKTNMGNVECYEVRTAEKLSLKTDMGNVTFATDDPYSGNGMDIELETSMGDVEANMGCYEEECAYELETDMGKVTINGESRGTKAVRNGSSSVKLDAESDMGNVDVFFLDDRW